MADVTIYNNVPAGYSVGSNSRIIWISSSVGYCFYNHTDTGTTEGGPIFYKKTTDGGATWGSEVQFLRPPSNTDHLGFFSVWYDKETPGITGTLIHVAASNWEDNNTIYANLDTSNDTAVVSYVVVGTNSAGDSYDPINYPEQQMSITKARGGNLYIWVKSFWGAGYFFRSTDNGANWTSRTSPEEGAGNDRAQLMPSGDTDNQDIACLYYDHDAFELSFKLYDDSGNSWGNETVIGDMDRNFSGAPALWSLAVAINPVDNKAWVCWYHNAFGAFIDEGIETAILTLTAAGKNSTSTTIVAASTSIQECCILIDANVSGTAYVGYLKGGTWGSSVDVYYKKTTDSMSTWGSETQLNTTAHDSRNVYCQTVIQSGQTGRFEPVWVDNGNNDIICNYGLSVEITTSSAVSASGAVTLSSLRAKGYGPRQTIRPDGTTDAGSWTAVGAGSLHAATNDDSNSSYANLDDGDDPSTMKLDLQTLSTPDVGDGTVILKVEAIP